MAYHLLHCMQDCWSKFFENVDFLYIFMIENNASFFYYCIQRMQSKTYVSHSSNPTVIILGQVADYKRLRGGVEFVKEIPRSASGKILRRLLKDELLSSQT